MFLHTASPFHFNATDVEKDLLIPAVNGTKSALLAVHKYGPNIERVVVTSSFAAIRDSSRPDGPLTIYTEQSWSQLTWETSKANSAVGYRGSKKLAEKAAWDFIKENKVCFELTVVNPVLVFGPQAFDSDAKRSSLNTSSSVIGEILKLRADSTLWSHISSFAVDVRDVAQAHIVGFQKEEAKGKRLFLTSGPFTDQTILDIIHKDFPVQGKDIPVGTPGSDLEVTKSNSVLDNSWTREVLGFKLTSVEDSIHDSVKQIFDQRLK